MVGEQSRWLIFRELLNTIMKGIKASFKNASGTTLFSDKATSRSSCCISIILPTNISSIFKIASLSAQSS